MATLTRTKASVEQVIALSQYLYLKGLKSSETVDFLKARNYTIKGIFFQASSVAFCISGMESKPSKPRAKSKKDS